jgi:hypothetical protein
MMNDRREGKRGCPDTHPLFRSHLDHRRTQEPIAEPIPAHYLLHHDIRFKFVGLFRGDGFVNVRVKGLADLSGPARLLNFPTRRSIVY